MSKVEQSGDDGLPPVAALFLVVFDRKVGYKIAWQRSTSDVDLEGSVEYKSLPSGLHNVESDLMYDAPDTPSDALLSHLVRYFTHDAFAGLSAFQSAVASDEERNARFVAVGVLVPMTYGRLGRAWMHAQGLRDLAESTVEDDEDLKDLESYWEKHRVDAVKDIRSAAFAEPSSPINAKPSARSRQKRRSRALSEATGFSPVDHVLSADHPALSMQDFLDAFGPLTFPLYRAALLRKRILLIGNAPILRSCNFVYDLSIFSNVPPSLTDALPTPEHLSRIRPLSNVGVHDIPYLAKSDSGAQDGHDGWIACSTDDILASKPQLYDILVNLPPASIEKQSKEWPHLQTSDGVAVKATQRDLRRYKYLRRELRRIRKLQDKLPFQCGDEQNGHESDDDTKPLIDIQDGECDSDDGEAEALVEPSSWTSIAYSSFLWWASAGERDAMLADEESQDSTLLEDLPMVVPSHRPSSRRSSKGKSASSSRRSSASHPATAPSDDSQGTAMLLIAYFHRLTSLMLEAMAEVVAAADDETEEGTAEDDVVVESEDMRRMGLDVWSDADKQFIRELSHMYFEREAEVKGHSVECCGIKIL